MIQKKCFLCDRQYTLSETVCAEDGTPLSLVLVGSMTGSTIGQRYEMLEEIGRGEAGAVYKARHLKLNHHVAVKILLSECNNDPNQMERFQNEARATCTLNHPNVIRVHDFDLLPDGLPYLVMDYLEGDNLQQLLEKEKRIELKRALRIFVQICSALAHAHKRNIVHRDLKPANVILVRNDDGEDHPVVLDFGIAKVFAVAGKNLRKLTKTGQIFVSPLYMSPEQCMGQALDCRSDIYGIGCLLYHCLTGETPFQGKNYLQTVFMHVNEVPEPMRSRTSDTRFPNELEDLVAKTLAKTPEKRVQTMHELGMAFAAVLDKLEKGGYEESDFTELPKSEPDDTPGDPRTISQIAAEYETTEKVAYELASFFNKVEAETTPTDEDDDPNIELPYVDPFRYCSCYRDSGADDLPEDDDGGDVEDDEYDTGLTREVRDLLKRAKRGDRDDQYDLGHYYWSGSGVRKNYRRAVYWFMKAAAQGEEDSMRMLAWAYYSGRGVPKSHKIALQWYLKAAQKEDSRGKAAVEVAWCYAWGGGTKQDIKKALHWYNIAVTKGHARAQLELGFIYECGLVVKRDLRKAADLYEQAARQGDKHGQCRLGVYFRDGLGRPQDYDEAVGWLECSMGQGCGFAKLELAVCYEHGWGVRQDHSEARRLLMQSAMEGCAEAAHRLGLQLQREGSSDAQIWTSRAQAMGYQPTDIGSIYADYLPKSTEKPPQIQQSDLGAKKTRPNDASVSESDPWSVAYRNGREVRWGELSHYRYFSLQEDGTALYRVRLGETLFAVVKDILREVHKNVEGYVPSFNDMRPIIRRIKEVNTHVSDFEFLANAQIIIIPADVVAKVTESDV